MSILLAIDPGPLESGWVVYKPDSPEPIVSMGIDNNEGILNRVNNFHLIDKILLEMISFYGKDIFAGASIFQTCVWIGRFIQASHTPYYLINRPDIKVTLCGSKKAKDQHVAQVLIDLYAPFVRNKGKGTKKEPGFFYGFHDHIWSAFAVAAAYLKDPSIAYQLPTNTVKEITDGKE